MKTVVITGATSGIGFAVVKALLQHNYRVIGIGRTQDSCEAARIRLAELSLSGAIFLAGDLLQLRETNRLADEITCYLNETAEGRLDALINNAGGVRSWYATTEDGFEQQFALNHLAGFLLSHKLMPCLQRCNGRILFTGSASHKGIDVNWEDIMFRRHYRPFRVYKQSKLCNLLTAMILNEIYGPSGIRAYVVDPGLVRTDIGNKQTGGLVSLVWSLRKRGGKSPEVPAKTYVYLCNQVEAPDGLYYFDSHKKPCSRYATDENAHRLHALSKHLCGLEPEASA